VQELGQTRKLEPQSVSSTPAAPPKPTAPAPASKAWKLTFIIDNEATTTIRLTVNEPLIVGRADLSEKFTLGLDLTAWGAQDKGVSRRHAQLAGLNGQVYLCDLGSVNGTRLNGVKLPSNHSALVKNGDVIECGRMRLVTYVTPTE